MIDFSLVPDIMSLNEVVVTARKRNETVVEVPMNITAVSSEEILKRNLIKKEDIYRTVAGAAFHRRGGSGRNGGADARRQHRAAVWWRRLRR